MSSTKKPLQNFHASLITNFDLHDTNLFFDYSSLFNDSRFSNLPVLRSSVRNLIVNTNAFQKVSRARFDENRAHTSSLHFSHLGQRQPFLTDSKVPYLSLLRKNTNSFYNTSLYSFSPLFSLNQYDFLINIANVGIYDFPFLLSQTSDVSRYS